MKRKIKRSLLLVVLLVVLCTSLTACSKRTDISNIDAIFDDRTITVSCPKDNAFILNIEIEANSTTTSWTSENLLITGGVPHTYALENLMGNYVSEDAKITTVNVQYVYVPDDLGISMFCLVIGLVFGLILGKAALP
ncbi:MAG: hypothetical protein HFJ60_05470 [Clostridia bacterium]|nr:hypothetical protein [Clostridia bacterium]